MKTMKQVTHYSSPDNPWGKSHTPKRYIHPPFSENIVTMWPNTIVLIGENPGGCAPQLIEPGRINECKTPSAGMAFLYRNQLPDSQNAIYETRNDGIPVHMLKQNFGTFEICMESFCDTERITTAFTKLEIRNMTDGDISDRISLIARTGREFDLLGLIDPDGYTPIEPSVNRWKTMAPWDRSQNKMSDQTYTVYFRTEGNMQIGFADQYSISFDFQLKQGENCVIYCAFGRGKCSESFDYDASKQATEAFWEQELKQIAVIPNKEDAEFCAMYRSLVAQSLQMFMYPNGMQYVIMRQGGLQRLMWPTENRSMIDAMVLIGDFKKYLAAILNTYFHVMQAENGEIINFGVPWAAVTGSVLDSFSTIAGRYEDFYEQYKEYAWKAFLWMEETRNATRKDPDLVGGLFPPKMASDYPGVCQMWGQTDVWNLIAYEKYAHMLQKRNDVHAQQVVESAQEYRSLLDTIFDKCALEQKDSEYFILPLDAGNNQEVEKNMRKTILAGGVSNEYRLISAGIGGYDSEPVRKLLKYRLETQRYFENGMVLPFDKSGVSNTGRRWYGNWLESKLYWYYRKIGKDNEAKELLDAQILYNMTPEYYMSERYDDCDPWYMPWCPNCSANGRTILMLCDWYLSERK